MNKDVNHLNWFEIPVSDINRAKAFYEKIFGVQMDVAEMMGMQMGFFPADPAAGKVNGAIVQGPMHKPSADGAVVYLNGNPDLQHVLDRIEAAGGSVVMPKTKISDEIGCMAFFIDSEGNRVALHSNN